MKKDKFVNMICEARRNFITKSAAVKLADDFEEKAEKAMEAYLRKGASGFCFYDWFGIHIETISLSPLKCDVDRVFSYKDTEDFSEDFEGKFLDEYLPFESLKEFFTELKARGYGVGLEEGDDVPLVVYFSCDDSDYKKYIKNLEKSEGKSEEESQENEDDEDCEFSFDDFSTFEDNDDF